jgi:hypothetical protein
MAPKKPTTNTKETPPGGSGPPTPPNSPLEFAQFRPQSEAIRERVWSRGLIVLDANVLLHLYRVDEKLRSALFDVLEDKNVAARLWFPHQVVAEFYANRASVIADQLRVLEKLSQDIANAFRGFPEAKETTRFLIDRAKLRELRAEAQTNIEKFIAEARSSYPASMSSDALLERLEAIILPRMGVRPGDVERQKLIDEGKRRLKEQVPPGFKDANKPENGDYFVWAQCLEKCAQDKRDLLLVTDDGKEDWWHRVHGLMVGARPELRAEFYAHVPTCEFVLTAFGDIFIERISKYMSTALPSEAIADARQFTLFHHRLEAAEDQNNEEEPDWDAERERAVQHYRDSAPTSDKEARTSTDAMVRWFFERYEDPANGVLYDGREGGYQYMVGGPYDAEEELREVFDDGTKRMERMIVEAVKRIENSGVEWVRRGEY